MRRAFPDFSPTMTAKAITLGLLLLFLAASVHAQSFAAETDFLWAHAASDDDYASGKVITGFIGSGTELRIPPCIQGIPVTEIAPWAFLGGSLTYLVFPDSITNIGAMAFASNNLAAVRFGSNITYIGMMAFTDNALTEIYFPEGLGVIGYRSFSAITYIALPFRQALRPSGILHLPITT